MSRNQKLDERVDYAPIVNDDGATKLFEAIVEQARDDYYLDIAWLANHGMGERDQVYELMNIAADACKEHESQKVLRQKIKDEKGKLQSVESREADLVAAREEIKKLEAELEVRKRLEKERKYMYKATSCIADIDQIENWVDHDRKILTTWRRCALRQYLKDLELDEEVEEKALDEMEDSTEELWITFAKIREKLNVNHKRKVRRSTSCRFGLPK